MSLENGLAAVNLEMPDRIPRTEYSAHFHWDLVNRVTGRKVSSKSSLNEQVEASREFIEAWDYGCFWNIIPFQSQFGDLHTQMGHAEFQQGGTDFSADKKQLFEDPEDIYSFDFWKAYGKREQQVLISAFNNDYMKMIREHPDTVNMTGIYTTCMSGIIEILGWNTLLLAAAEDQQAFGSFINRYVEWNLQYFTALAKSDSPVVMVHDDIVWTQGAFIHPDFYRQFIFPNYKKLFKPLVESGKKILYTSDGTYTEFVDDIADCQVDGFIMEPTTDMEYICHKYGKTHVIIGNADTRILLNGSREEIENEVKRCINMGKNCPGYFLAVGNHIPPNTPVDNCLFYNEMYEKYCHR